MSHELLKDAEARIRALTREVGTLREDLRRECKRRERAVAQASQNEDLRTSAEAKVHELEYASKKLAAQLESAKEMAQASSERDRRGMRSLREGLAVVEKAVATRAQQGKELLGVAFDCLEGLKLQLLDGDPASGAACLPPELELQVSIMLTEAMTSLSQMEELLASLPSSLQEQPHSPEGVAARMSSSPPMPQPSTSSSSWLHEKAELQEQMAYLKSQVIILKATAEQAAAAAVAAAASKADATNPEMLQLHSSLQQARQENEMLLRDLTELEQRLQHREQQLQQHEATSSQLQSFIHELQESGLQAEQHIGQLQEQVVKLQSTRTLLEQENGSLANQLQEQQRELGEQSRRLASMQGAISEQNQDVRTALQLISHRDAMRGALKPASSGSGVTGRLEQSATHRNALLQRQRDSSVPFLLDTASAVPRPLPAGHSLARSSTGWSRPAPADYLPQQASSFQGTSDLGASRQQTARTNLPTQPTITLLPHAGRRTAISRDWHAAGGMLPSNPAAGASMSEQALATPSPGHRQSGAPDLSAINRDAVATALAARAAAAAAASSSAGFPSQAPAAVQREAKALVGQAAQSLDNAGWPADNLRDDMRELDQEILQLDALLKRAVGLASV